MCCNSWKSENGWPDECADWVFHQNFMFMVFICVKSKVHVFGVPCLAESCIRNPKFSICNQWSECGEEFGNLTCWSIWSVKWYMQQPGWMQDATSRNCGSYILSKKHDSNLGFLRQWFRTETGIQVQVWCHDHYIYIYIDMRHDNGRGSTRTQWLTKKLWIYGMYSNS